MINAVDENLDELEELIQQGCSALDCDPLHIAAAGDRLAIARSSLGKGDLTKAADQTKSAYDAVDADGNVVLLASDCLQFQE